MKRKNLFWGLFFLVAAAVIIINQLGYFGTIGLPSLILTVLLIPIIIASAVRLNFVGILFPAAFICIIYAKPWGIENLVPWPILLTALFGSVGLSIIFKKARFHVKYKKRGTPLKGEDINVSATTQTTEDNTFESRVSFSACSQYINSTSLQRAYLSCSFGAMQVYFDNAQLHPDGAVVEVNCSFGGMEIYIPKTWNVIDNIQSTLAGVDEKNRRTGGDGPTLTLTGDVKFSGVEIIYV